MKALCYIMMKDDKNWNLNKVQVLNVFNLYIYGPTLNRYHHITNCSHLDL